MKKNKEKEKKNFESMTLQYVLIKKIVNRIVKASVVVRCFVKHSQ